MRRAATILSAIVMALTVLGLVMLYSTSSARTVNPHFYLQRQLAWLVVATLAGVVVTRMDYRLWRRFAVPLAAVTVVLLALVFVPGIGAEIKGSNRWIQFGPAGFKLGFQPSEISKLTVIVCMSAYMAKFGRHGYLFTRGLLYPMLGLGVIAGMVILEPDFGTTFTASLVAMCIMFAGGTRVLYLLGTGVCGLAGFVVAIFFSPNRIGRVMSFLWPEKYPDQAYHLTQSLYSFYLGGAFGVGLGNSIQKRFYLPEAHTDFILAIIAEELGLIATLMVLLLFVGYFMCGMSISRRAPDPFGRLLGFGVTMMITLQAGINMAVVTGLGPTKGLPLPFISYGGSSLVLSIVMSAVLLSIARSSSVGVEARPRVIKDCAHDL
jgi:cell division protein FtsW